MAKLIELLSEHQRRSNEVPEEVVDRTDEILGALERVSEGLTAVIQAIEGIRIPEPLDRTEEVLEAVKGIPGVDLEPVLDAVKAIEMPEVEQRDVDLSPVLGAIKSIPKNEVDLTPVIEAVNELKQDDSPREWRIVHERDKRGNITGTRVVAED